MRYKKLQFCHSGLTAQFWLRLKITHDRNIITIEHEHMIYQNSVPPRNVYGLLGQYILYISLFKTKMVCGKHDSRIKMSNLLPSATQ